MSLCPACPSENPSGAHYCCRCGEALAAAGHGRTERRDLTVMFCDLADSTELAVGLDLEDLHEVVCAYQGTCGAAVSRHGGHVAQYLGDGVLVYFGYPESRVDDAARAGRTALEILEEVERLNRSLGSRLGVQISVRVGIHSGPTVLGDLGGRGRRERLAVGETVNVASRLQQLAEPGSVLVSGATRRRLGGRFALEGGCSRRLKGLAEPVETHRLARPPEPEGAPVILAAEAGPELLQAG